MDLTNARAMPLTHWERAAGGLQGDGTAIRNQRVQKSRCAEIILCNARSQGHVIACVSPCEELITASEPEQLEPPGLELVTTGSAGLVSQAQSELNRFFV